MAEIRHTNPLQCSECKIFECGKKLANVKKHVGEQADYLHAPTSEMYSELFISKIKSTCNVAFKGHINLNGKNANKSVLTQVKACTQKQTFNNVNAP